MRAIDQKGKIFGKLNVIDLIVILLIIVVLALVGYKLVFSNGAMSGGGQKIVYTVKVEGVEPEVYEFIQESLPSQLMSSNEMLDAYVTAVEGTPVENDTYQTVGIPILAARSCNGSVLVPMTWSLPLRVPFKIPCPANWAARKSGWANPTL